MSLGNQEDGNTIQRLEQSRRKWVGKKIWAVLTYWLCVEYPGEHVQMAAANSRMENRTEVRSYDLRNIA